jgi:hypothetical protein
MGGHTADRKEYNEGHLYLPYHNEVVDKRAASVGGSGLDVVMQGSGDVAKMPISKPAFLLIETTKCILLYRPVQSVQTGGCVIPISNQV